MNSDYNSRLFKTNKIRSSFHLSSFNWLTRTIKKYSNGYQNII